MWRLTPGDDAGSFTADLPRNSQKPPGGTRSARLNLLEAFSQAISAVNSTTASSSQYMVDPVEQFVGDIPTGDRHAVGVLQERALRWS